MVNHLILQGRMVAPAELKFTPSGVSVTSFRVAWSRRYKETEVRLFLNCVAWRGTAELVSKHFGKGQEILLEGEMNTREYVDRDGNKRQTMELVVSQVHFCGPRRDDAPSGAGFTDRAEPPQVVDFPNQREQFEELSDPDGQLPF